MNGAVDMVKSIDTTRKRASATRTMDARIALTDLFGLCLEPTSRVC
jgi:hypothetical protein